MCEFAVSRGVTIDFLLSMEEMEYNVWKDPSKKLSKQQLQAYYVGVVERTFRPCIGVVLFNSAKTMSSLLKYTPETTPYHAVLARTDWERALLMASDTWFLIYFIQNS
jgi:hypothetical protein